MVTVNPVWPARSNFCKCLQGKMTGGVQLSGGLFNCYPTISLPLYLFSSTYTVTLLRLPPLIEASTPMVYTSHMSSSCHHSPQSPHQSPCCRPQNPQQSPHRHPQNPHQSPKDSVDELSFISMCSNHLRSTTAGKLGKTRHWVWRPISDLRLFWIWLKRGKEEESWPVSVFDMLSRLTVHMKSMMFMAQIIQYTHHTV